MKDAKWVRRNSNETAIYSALFFVVSLLTACSPPRNDALHARLATLEANLQVATRQAVEAKEAAERIRRDLERVKDAVLVPQQGALGVTESRRLLEIEEALEKTLKAAAAQRRRIEQMGLEIDGRADAGELQELVERVDRLETVPAKNR